MIYAIGNESSLEIKIKMLYGKGDDILCQYVAFTKIFDEQRKLHKEDIETAIKETIRICKDKNILKAYLESREKEVGIIMLDLYNEEKILRNHDSSLSREIARRVSQKVSRQSAITTAKKDYKRGLYSEDMIISDLSETLQISLDKAKNIFETEVLELSHV